MGNLFLWIIGGLLVLFAGGVLAIYMISGGPVSYIDQAASEQLEDVLGQASVTVYPAWVRTGKTTTGYNVEAAQRIAEAINDEGLFIATTSEVEPQPLDAIGHVNQQHVAKATADSFAAFVSTQQLETDYAFMAEYFVGTESAAAVHFYIVTRDGRIAAAATINNHYSIFQEVQPQTVADCTEIVIRHLVESFE
jgi:hypothetical protein